MENKAQLQTPKFWAIVFLTAILAFGGGYLAHVQPWKKPQVEANVYVFVESPEGTALIASKAITVHNTITDIGEKLLRDWLSGANVTSYIVKYIALGNSTVDQTKTKLDTEATGTGFIRTEGSIDYWVSSGDYAYNCTNKFTATDYITINAASAHWNSTSNSDGNMYALASLGGSQQFQNGWNCTIVWVFVFNAN